jgi:hypothetical protein
VVGVGLLGRGNACYILVDAASVNSTRRCRRDRA